MLLAALGVFGTGAGWPDLIVAGAMAALALQGGSPSLPKPYDTASRRDRIEGATRELGSKARARGYCRGMTERSLGPSWHECWVDLIRGDIRMKRFVAIYLGSATALAKWKATDDQERKEQEKAGMDAWMKWAKKNEASIVDLGSPLGKTKRIDASGHFGYQK